MLDQPISCSGCPLSGISTGFMVPQFGSNGVLLLGEALGEHEAEAGEPFQGKAGFRLNRLIEWAGFNRRDFSIANACFCRPPANKLEGTPYEFDAVAHCRRQHWDMLLQHHRVVVPLGNVALNAMIHRKSILTNRGYVWPVGGQYVIGTVHPSFVQRGQSKWSAPFIADLQKAVLLAAQGMPPQLTNYTLDPSPLDALRWAEEYRRQLARCPTIYLAFDIETPGKPDDEDDADTDSDAPDRTWNIDRIGFSYRGLHAISFRWEPQYFAAIRLLLASHGPKVVWNAGFDVPRVRRAGFVISGVIHDGMVAWHILHSDLPKRLAFVATFTCPWQPAWKHLSGAQPAFYNATDADVELRSMEVIEGELRRTGLWEVYQRDVVDLEPILVHMHDRGMPIDAAVRLANAITLDDKLTEVTTELERCFPLETRKVALVYKKEPKDVTGLYSRPGNRLVRRCAQCGLEQPRKDHFKRYVKKHNPCADGTVWEGREVCSEWYRLSGFSPSRDQLVRYHQYLGRKLPTVFDGKTRKRKVSFGEEQLRQLILDFPNDPVYNLVLSYREIDKLAGTYVGRPSDG